MSAPAPTAHPFALSIYLRRAPDGSIVINEEVVEEFADDDAHKLVVVDQERRGDRRAL